MKKINEWYTFEENEPLKQNFVCLVKFNTIDAGIEYRLMVHNIGKWFEYQTMERRFPERIIECMPIEFI